MLPRAFNYPQKNVLVPYIFCADFVDKLCIYSGYTAP